MTEGHPARGAGARRRVFVGRDAELAELSAALDEARTGRGRLYLVCGEPGIGKTRLADELARAAAERGMAVHWGRCWEAGGAPAYWPWLDVLAALGEQLPDDALGLLGAGGEPLSELVPGLRARLGVSPARVTHGADEARFGLFRAISVLLRRAGEAGALVVLEDLHSADESSLLLLRFLAHELRTTRVLVLATFRDVEARLSPEVGEALGRLTREGTTLALSRLAAPDAERFLRERTGVDDPALHEHLFRRTQGNPLFLEEMARLVGSDGEAALSGAVLPHGVREVLRQRLARVPGTVRALLDAVAVCGDECEATLLAEALAESAQALRGQLDVALHAGVLVEREAGLFRFSHALVREVLESDLSAEQSRALHGAVAAALERRAEGHGEAPLAELAHHWLEGPAGALPKAVRYAIDAAERALALYAFEDAIRLLTRARTALGQGAGEPHLVADVLIALAQVQIRRGKGALGRELCMEAMRIGRELGDAELLARAALAFGLEITAALVDAELVKVLEEAQRALPATDSPLRARVLARLGAALQPHPDLLYPIGLAREAIASARRLGDPGTLLYTAYTGMAAMMDIVDPRERLPLNLEVEQLASAAGDRERLLRTQVRLVFDHMELGDFAGADARIALFERLAREAGARRYLWRVPLFHAMRAMIHGRFAEAEALLAEARRGGEEAQDPQLESAYVMHREGLLRAAERHEDMIAYDVEARRMRAHFYSGPHWQNGGSAFTYARIEDLEKARLYTDLIPQEDWPLVHNPPAFMHLGEPLALVGRRELVEKLYALLLPASHRCISWGFTKFIWDGTATRVLGLLAARLERWDEASAHFEAAIGQLERLEAWPYLARTRYELGRALSAAGSPERARELVQEAAESARALGMSGLARLAEQRLAMSWRPAPKAAAVPASLPFSFTPEGEYWTVTHEGATFRLKDSLGLGYLARLFAEPGRAIHVLELSGGKPEEGERPDLGDAGELLDEQALASYRSRAASLRDALEEAEEFGDLGRASRAREELAFLEAELSRAVGLGGRRRRAGAASERARSAVQRRIKNALERVAECSPGLAERLEREVKTGTFCVYRPDS
jgi:tetratricopeptide (TPR) repeat protein